jgi:hypothetical protein
LSKHHNTEIFAAIDIFGFCKRWAPRRMKGRQSDWTAGHSARPRGRERPLLVVIGADLRLAACGVAAEREARTGWLRKGVARTGRTRWTARCAAQGALRRALLHVVGRPGCGVLSNTS